MKLFLTSAGLTTDELRSKVAVVAGAYKRVVFIPTARATVEGLHPNHAQAIAHLRAAGFTQIDVIDPSVEGTEWRTQLEVADVIYLGGGNTFYLMYQLSKTGLGQWLIESKDSKIYVGESAGSIVMTPNIAIASVDDGDVNEVGLDDLSGLGLVDFEVSPHTPEDVSIAANKEYAKTIDRRLYAYDNSSALFVDDDTIELINEQGFASLE